MYRPSNVVLYAKTNIKKKQRKKKFDFCERSVFAAEPPRYGFAFVVEFLNFLLIFNKIFNIVNDFLNFFDDVILASHGVDTYGKTGLPQQQQNINLIIP